VLFVNKSMFSHFFLVSQVIIKVFLIVSLTLFRPILSATC